MTSRSGLVTQVTAGVTVRDRDGLALVRDEAVLEILNHYKPSRGEPGTAIALPVGEQVSRWLEGARDYAVATADTLRLPFARPLISDLALFWPEGADGA